MTQAASTRTQLRSGPGSARPRSTGKVAWLELTGVAYARGLNGRTDLLLAYREILRLDDDTDKYIRIELGLPLDDPNPLDRSSLDAKLKDELDGIINGLAAEVLPLLHVDKVRGSSDARATR